MPTPRRMEKSASLTIDQGSLPGSHLSHSSGASPAAPRRGPSSALLRTAGSSAVQSPAPSKPQSPIPSPRPEEASHYAQAPSASGTSSPTPNSSASAGTNPQARTYWNVTTLDELLTKLGLQNYIETFGSQEVDLSTFLTLSENDLKELGVTTFGARRKMVMGMFIMGVESAGGWLLTLALLSAALSTQTYLF